MLHRQVDYPLLRFHDERAAIVRETAERALAATLRKGAPEYILNDTCLQELRRLGSDHSGVGEVRDLSAWRRLYRHIGGMAPPERVSALSALIADYVEDVAGGFDRRVYGIASRAVPGALGVLLSPQGLGGLGRALSPGGLESLVATRLKIEGPVAELCRLASRGTLVVVPTHLSNLDSPLMGYALQLAGLPPTTYGAGKNLFTNPLLGFFMRNCGAYRVDRRIRHDLYKDVLKTYSQVILERGYHSMFFPGGTRSRSGRVEEHLKLGLLGTTLPATVTRLRREARLEAGAAVRPIYIVPATINLQLVLEAETLIADYLKETGKARFIIEDDESSKPLKVLQFGRSLLRLSDEGVVRFGAPLDVLGNPVDGEGRSLDPHGRVIDLARYFLVKGQPQVVPQRDAEYMQDVGQVVVQSFRRDTVLMATHLLASVVFGRISAALPNLDVYARLRAPLEGTGLSLAVPAVLADIERLQGALRARGHRLGHGANGSPQEVLETALLAFASYHAERAVYRRGADLAPGAAAPPVTDELEVGDRQLLYYYQNRIDSLGVKP